jgi:hypothetical protein
VTDHLPFEPHNAEPHDFDPFAGFTGGVEDQPGTGLFPSAAEHLFDPSGLALQFGPPPVGSVDDYTDPGSQHLNWYDAPHHW